MVRRGASAMERPAKRPRRELLVGGADVDGEIIRDPAPFILIIFLRSRCHVTATRAVHHVTWAGPFSRQLTSCA